MPDPAPPPSFSPFDITKGLLEAIRAWSDHLRGERPRSDWGVFGAMQFLQSVGFDIPQEPISTDDLKRLEVLAQTADWARSAKNTNLKKFQSVLEKQRGMTDTVSKYFEENCNVMFSVDVNPTDAIQSSCDSFDTAIATAQANYSSAPDLSIYDTSQANADNNYEAIADKLDGDDLPQSEYDVVTEIGDTAVDATYWAPPPPSEIAQRYGQVPDPVGE